MVKLRRKLGDPPLIETMPGAGYRSRDRVVDVRAADRPPAPHPDLRRPVPRGRDRAARPQLRPGVSGASTARRGPSACASKGWPAPSPARLSTSPGPPPTRRNRDGRRPAPRPGPGRLPGRARDTALHQLVVQSSVALGIVALAVGRRRLARRRPGPAPAHQVTATARRLSEDNLHERLALDGPDDELKELADTFDAMLGRLEAAFDSQRRFVANASHELRTPLAIQRTVVDVALADPDTSPEAVRAMAAAVRDAVDRSERLIDGLLVLARSERGRVPPGAGRPGRGRRRRPRTGGGRDRSRRPPSGADLDAGADDRQPGPARTAGGQPRAERRPPQPARWLAQGSHGHRRADSHPERRQRRPGARSRPGAGALRALPTPVSRPPTQ